MNAETIKNTIQAIIDGLTPLAQKLAVPLEKVFEWAVRENYVIAIENCIGILITLIIFITFLICLTKSLKIIKTKNEYGRDYNEWDRPHTNILGKNAIISLITGFLCCILIPIMFFDFIPGTLGRLINPEYHALLDIVDIIKPNNNINR